MRGLIRTCVAVAALGLMAIAVISKWPIAEPKHLGMLAGDAYRGAYLARSSECIACHTNAAAGGAFLGGGHRLIHRSAALCRQTSHQTLRVG